MIRFFLFQFFLLSFLGGYEVAFGKDFIEYWAETGLSSADVEKILDSESCYKSERESWGCLGALNSLLESEGLAFTQAGKQPSLLDGISSVAVVEKDSLSGVKGELGRKEWLAFFASKSREPFSFEKIFHWLKDRSRTASKTEFAPHIIAQAINIYLSRVKDPHTSISPAAYDEDLKKGEELQNYSGVGADLTLVDDGIAVASLKKLGPAMKAGLQEGDRLLEIDSLNVESLPLSEVIHHIRGESGSFVNLLVKRGGQRRSFRVQRAPIVSEVVESRLFDDSGMKFGYLKINSFQKDATCSKTAEHLSEMVRQGIEGVILDLRGNVGGDIAQAACVTGIFIGEGKIATYMKASRLTLDLLGAKMVFNLPGVKIIPLLTNQKLSTTLPMVTLIDEGSASAAEILAGALQDYRRSVIMGFPSFGKGTLQSEATFENNPKIHIHETTGRFYRPSGRSNQLVGVIPDLEFQVRDFLSQAPLFPREIDCSSALPSEGEPWIQPRPEIMERIEKCLKGTEQVELFAASLGLNLSSGGATQLDKDLLGAENALGCMKRLGIDSPGWDASISLTVPRDFVGQLYQF